MGSSSNAVQCLWETASEVGESPVWVPAEGALYFVDIYTDRIHRYEPSSAAKKTWTVPGQVSAIVPRKQGGFLASAKHSIAELDLEHSRLKPWLEVDEPETSRLNDGKCDARGRYYTASMDERKLESSGKLYLVDESKRPRVVDTDYVVSNGPTFSLDGRVLYHADTFKHVVYQFDVREDGTLANKRVFRTFVGDEGRPDGMTTDTDGCIWIAHAGGNRVSRFTPSGEVDRAIALPVSKVTSLAFGGSDYRTLYITTARKGLDAAALALEPLAGALFAVDPGVQGLPAAVFAG